MRPRRFLFFIAFLASLAAQPVLAQEFTVMSVSGQALVDGQKPAKIGMRLNQGQSLRLGQGAYLGLVYKTGLAVELDRAGNFAVSDMAKAAALKGKSSTSEKFVDFLVKASTSKIFSADESLGKYATSAGTVERAIGGGPQFLSPSESAFAQGDSLVLYYTAQTGNYVLVVKNMFEEELWAREVAGGKAILPTINLGESTLYCHLASKEDPDIKSTTLVLEAKKPLDEESLGSDLETLLQAYRYEQKGFFVDAHHLFKGLVETEQGQERFGDHYQAFLERNGLN